MPEDRTGILIIRAWLERESTAPLRAHIRQTTDIAGGLRDGTTVTNEDAVATIVRTWLHDVLLDTAPPPDPEPAS